MAGLLGDDYEDPKTQGILGLALSMLANSGPSAQPRSLGQIIGVGGQAGMQAHAGRKRAQLLENEDRRRDEELRMTQAERQMRLDEIARQKAAEAELRATLAQFAGPMTNQDALAAGGGPTNAAAAMVGQRRTPDDYQSLIARGVPPQLVEALAKSADYGRPKVARTIEVDDGRGGKATMQVDDFGRPVGDSLPGYVAPVQVNQGDRVTFTKPAAGLTLPIGMSPSERDASARGWAGVGLTRDRLEFDRQQKENPPAKPLPPTALKLQSEALDKIGVASAINTDINGLSKMIDDGKLTFGPVSNLTSKARNLGGMSNEQSRNFAEFTANMERLRNESLRLNTGVQTEGDAQRAWNELFASINDKELVRQNLGRIAALNKRAADLKKLELDQVRANYGLEPMDYSRFDALPASVNRGSKRVGGAEGSWDAGGPRVVDWNSLPGGR